jgi:hypothetical protein
MQPYVVQVWKTVDRIAKEGAADYFEPCDANTPADAAKKIVEVKHISGKFYIEVRPKDDNKKCWGFDDLSPELNS